MLIDCETCALRELACHDCVVSVFLGLPVRPDTPVDLDGDEQHAIDRLVAAGLVPPLRLVALPAPYGPDGPDDFGRADPRAGGGDAAERGIA